MNSECPHEDQGAARNPKRLKTSHVPSNGGDQTQYDATVALEHEDYTIAWICALPLELAASRAMLDVQHPQLPIKASDDNTYVLGRADQHNVVMTCLPGQYGTNNAALVAANLKGSFPNIRATLMVGIGGGSPSQADLRLGDVVVGTRVIQYDLGKVIGDGIFHVTADAKTPTRLLNSAVSNLRSKHGPQTSSSRMASLLQARLPSCSRPIEPDRLFLASYEHPPEAKTCDDCDLGQLQPRSAPTDQPRVHYGVIASGNRVMKNGKTRDEIALPYQALCFEMEAAGMMDNLQCLPIRGICDYSDTHKNKMWQDYAAATAAAYARELLEVIPPLAKAPRAAATLSTHTTQLDFASKVASTSHCDAQLIGLKVDQSPERRKIMLDSLDFPQLDARKTNIQTAHIKTCRWLLKHPAYKDWLDPTKQLENHGFLWMRGKAGAGKSTMMKFAYRETKKLFKQPNEAIVASFFFNARGEYLEKSITGMYRSLLLQIMKGFPDLQCVLDDTEIIPLNQQDCPDLNALKELLSSAILKLGQRSLTCFIDALDECDELEVRDMVHFFEELAEDAADSGIGFRVFFSSRPYPHVEIHRGILFTLEEESGHKEDLAKYVKSRLRITNRRLLEEVQLEVLSKAAGIFMWIVLVVEILNKESSRGSLAIRTRLSEIPGKLTDLFKSIVTRDQERKDWLLLCVLWILCAQRPLTPAEFSHALWAGLLSQESQIDHELPDTTDIEDCMKLITSSSKGLAEITKSKQPKVQFIHESVRDFLVKERGLNDLWPELGFEWEAPSHERLKGCCAAYLRQNNIQAIIENAKYEDDDGRNILAERFPFLDYASQQMLAHADAAAPVVSQDEFLSEFFDSDGAKVLNLFERFKTRQYRAGTTPLYMLADKGWGNLVRTRMKTETATYAPQQRYEQPLFAALANGHEGAVAALLGLPSNPFSDAHITEGLRHRKDMKRYKGCTPLSWAAQEGRLEIAKLLVQGGADPNEVDERGSSPLCMAALNGNEAIARLLLDEGAEVDAQDDFGCTSLCNASLYGYDTIARLLIGHGANVNTQDSAGRTPLINASRRGHKSITRLLISEGAEVNIWDEAGDSALTIALRRKFETIAGLLIDRGADVNALDKYGNPALMIALQGKSDAIVQLLIDQGAEVNVRDISGYPALTVALRREYDAIARLLISGGADLNARLGTRETPLMYCSLKGDGAMARLLIDNGADVNSRIENGFTALHYAGSNGHKDVVKLLLEKGADVDAPTDFGFTPLHRASQKGLEDIVRILIAKGADVNAQDVAGGTALDKALEKGFENIVQLLVMSGAETS